MTENEKDLREDAHDDKETSLDATATAAADATGSALVDEEEAYDWAEPPAFEIAHKEDCVCEVKVTIPAANVKAMLDEVYKEVNDGVQVPGFRRGKAPRRLLEKRLGKYARSTVAERLADHATQRLLKEHDLRPIAKADIQGLDDTENLPEDQDMVYTVSFDTPGKCELGDYKSIEISKPELDIMDKDVDETIEGMRVRFGRYEPLEGGVAEEGDQVIITFKGTVNGEDFEGNSAENYPYILGSKRFSEEMETAIRGTAAGQTVSASFEFPDDYRDNDVAGKTAHYDITINEIKRRVLPPLDEEFAKRVGHDSLDALRESIRARIREDADERIKGYMHRQALEKLVECSTFTLPKSQVQSFIDREYQAIENRLVQQHVPAEEIEKERPELQELAEKQGLFAIKSMYAVYALVEAENISVSEEDFDAYARALSQGDDERYELMKEYLVTDEARGITEYRILETKALDRLTEMANIVITPLVDDDDAEAGTDDTDDNKEKKDD